MKPDPANIEPEILEKCHELMRLVKTRRWAKIMTQRELAKAMGSSQMQITKIESLKQIPSIAMFTRMCTALGLEIKLVPVESERTTSTYATSPPTARDYRNVASLNGSANEDESGAHQHD